MTLRIPKSAVTDADAFKKTVDRYIAELTAHNYSKGKPRPVAPHPLVEQAINRVVRPRQPDQFVPDYEILDDTPEPEFIANIQEPVLTFEDKKNILLGQLTAAEIKARHRILTPGRARLFSAEYNILKSKGDKLSDQEKEQLAEKQVILDKCHELELAAAHVHIAIDDLTEYTIDNFKIPEL